MRTETLNANFLRFVLPWHSKTLVRQVAGEVARQCRSRLLQRVCRHTGNMSMAEIRGYLRAQAAECVVIEVDEAVGRGRLQMALRSARMDAAIDQLVTAAACDAFFETSSVDTRAMAA